jgi:hypothetical protein
MQQPQKNKEKWIAKAIEQLEDLNQKLIHEDYNVLTFVGDIECFLKLEALPAKFQRQLDEKRVLDILEYQKMMYLRKNRVENVNPIYLTYYESHNRPNPFEIIDGQHRYYSFQKLFQEIKNFKIEYKIIICEDDNESYSYFNLINLSKPLILHRNRKESEEMKKLLDHIKIKYKKYIKNSKNPRLPNMNLDELESNLRKLGLIRKCIEREIDVLSSFESLNDFYKEIEEKNPEKWGEWGVSHHTDIEEPKFYFGLYKNFEWICHWLKHIVENKEFNSFPHSSCISTERITKKLRKELWKKHFGEMREGMCCICEEKITEDNFHSGHIIARAKGGETKLNNLKPICQTCNQDMKIENMDEYKERLDNQLR